MKNIDITEGIQSALDYYHNSIPKVAKFKKDYEAGLAGWSPWVSLANPTSGIPAGYGTYGIRHRPTKTIMYWGEGHVRNRRNMYRRFLVSDEMPKQYERAAPKILEYDPDPNNWEFVYILAPTKEVAKKIETFLIINYPTEFNPEQKTEQIKPKTIKSTETETKMTLSKEQLLTVLAHIPLNMEGDVYGKTLQYLYTTHLTEPISTPKPKQKRKNGGKPKSAAPRYEMQIRSVLNNSDVTIQIDSKSQLPADAIRYGTRSELGVKGNFKKFNQITKPEFQNTHIICEIKKGPDRGIYVVAKEQSKDVLELISAQSNGVH